MALPLRQQTAPSDPSAAEVAAQIRQQVQQQMKNAAADARRQAKSSSSDAKQAAAEKQQAADLKQTAPLAPVAPVAPVAPEAPVTTGTTIPSDDTPFDVPPRLEHLGYGFLLMLAVIAVGKPLARALGSVIEKRGLRSAPQDFAPRLERIEQGIEAVSIEIERISESQRYLLKMKAPAEPAEIPRGAS